MSKIVQRKNITIKHKCEKTGEVVYSKSEQQLVKQENYNEHAAMHYDCSGWSTWYETYYEVEKCKSCGEFHSWKKEK